MADETKKAAQDKKDARSDRPFGSKRHVSKYTPYVRDLRKIHVGARELGLDTELLHDLVKSITGKTSLKDLDATERGKVILELQRKGAFRYKKRGARSEKRANNKPQTTNRKPGGKATEIITPAQQDFIHDLWVGLSEYGEEFARPNFQTAFIKRIIGKQWPQKKWEAQKIIEALKSRISQERRRLERPF